MNIDDMEGLDEATCKDIKKLMKITRETHGGENFAEAQGAISDLLFKSNKKEAAIKFWSNIQRSDDPELYAKVQINIGIFFAQKNDRDDALYAWSKVQRSDSPEAYAKAQFYTGSYLSQEGHIWKAIDYFKNIRHEDEKSIYVEAKFRIASICFMNENFEEARSYWGEIELSDSPEAYAKAIFNIAESFFKEERFSEAVLAFGKVERSHNPAIFAQALFKKGTILKNEGNNKEAINVWKDIKRSDSADAFAKAKFNIAILLKEEEKVDEALNELSSIQRDDNKEIFAYSQYNIGCDLKDRGDYEKALLSWCSIKRLDSPEIYAKAKIKTGFLLEETKSAQEAISEWSMIKRSDFPEAYAVAQANIGYLQIKNSEIAKVHYLNINNTDSPRIYSHAQFKLGLISIEQGDTGEARKHCKESRADYPYEIYCCEKICDFIDDAQLNKFGLKSFELLESTSSIVDILKLSFGRYKDEEQPFERKLAHYTSRVVCEALIGNSEEGIVASPFRVNTTNNVNDPSEGQLLIKKLQRINDNKFNPLNYNNNIHAFLSCFTFNHDSLNQFRLYGKENYKEASGVSLVFNKEFFKDEKDIGGISYLPIFKSGNEFAGKNVQGLIANTSNSVEEKKVLKHSVMRCVYLDPTSDYIHLAQRSRLTFFREFGCEEVPRNGTQQLQAEYEWNLYKKYIREITDNFKSAYDELKNIYTDIEKEIESIRDKMGNAKADELTDFVDKILLPLKYLVKHSAFQEEQECRIIYITTFDADEVVHEDGGISYVKYEPSVKDHLNKIYIAPAATDYKQNFEYLLKGADVPVEKSENVFR